MRTQALATFVALASTASANYDWSGASPFTCPGNTDNHCSSSQSGGFGWGGLGLGSFSSYGGFSFEGWSCASSFGAKGKRDQLTGRNFQDKCIVGSASSDVTSCPSFNCDSTPDVSAFSVDEFQISVEFDCTLEFHYGMPGGDICKQSSSCSKSGTTVKNTQCGGAKNVTVVYPGGGSGGGKSSCSIGVHSIGFDCSSHSTKPTQSYTVPPVTTTSVPTTPASSPATTTPAYSTPATSSAPETTPTSSAGGETTPSVPSSSAPATSPTSSAGGETTPSVPSSTETPVTSPATYGFTTSTVYDTTVVSTIISCAETVKDCPGRSTSTILTTLTTPVSTTICPVTETTPVSSPAGVTTTSEVPSTTPEVSPTSSPAGPTTTPEGYTTTVIVDTSTTVCPVTLTHTTGGTTSIETGTTTSTILITSTNTVCTKCEHPTSSPAGEVTPTTPSGPATTAPCPEILPQCLNTWMFSSSCGSNTDSSCYCPSSEFVCNVFECLSAHGASDSDIASAQTYFQGICAPHVGSNPAIVTCASSIAPSGPVVTAASVPVTTIDVFTTLTVPCSESGTAIPSSSTVSVLSTAITVPQVIFQTVTGSTTASAALVVGTPTAAPAGALTTPAGVPAATTIATVPVSNGTLPTSSPSASQFIGASSRVTFTFSSLFGAVLVALFAM